MPQPCTPSGSQPVIAADHAIGNTVLPWHSRGRISHRGELEREGWGHKGRFTHRAVRRTPHLPHPCTLSTPDSTFLRRFPTLSASILSCRTFISQTKVASSRQYVLAIPPRQTCKHTLSVKKLVNRKRQRTRTRACCTLRHVRVSCKQRCWRGTHLRGKMRCSILTGRQITLAVRSRTWGRFGMLLLPDSLFSTSDRSLAGMRYVWL